MGIIIYSIVMLFTLPYTAQNKQHSIQAEGQFNRSIIRFYNNKIYKIKTYEN